MENGNIILEKSIEFSLAIIEFCEVLDEQRKYVISKQLLRSGSSIGANIHEAQSAESRADFVHKLKIAAKEASETEYWLTLCNKSKNHPSSESLSTNLLSLQKLLSRIISSAKQNSKQNK